MVVIALLRDQPRTAAKTAPLFDGRRIAAKEGTGKADGGGARASGSGEGQSAPRFPLFLAPFPRCVHKRRKKVLYLTLDLCWSAL